MSNHLSVAPLSVVLASFNGARYIEPQLQSILRQDPPPAEVVVSDDCSTDGTVAVVEGLAKRSRVPIRLLVNEQRRGYANNFLFAALEASQPLVAFSDQDDVWLPGKVAAALAAFADRETMAWTHRATAVDGELRQLRRRRLHTGLSVRSSRRDPLQPIAACRLVFRAELLHLFPPQRRCRSVYGDVDAEHDEWVSFAAHALGRIGWDATSRLMHRRHGTAIGQYTPAPLLRPGDVLIRTDALRVSTVAVAAEERAVYLRERSHAPECAQVRDRLLREATRYMNQVPRLERRAATRLMQPGPRRAIRIAAATVRGDYGRISAGGLGWWAGLQDAYALGAARRTS